LFAAANTGFLGRPAVLANMAPDSWVPHQHRYLSTRLATRRGILLMGLCALGILVVTRSSVAILVVLYSINVFLTFSLSLLGICVYWWQHRRNDRRWLHRLALSFLGLFVTFSILLITLIEKLNGWRMDDVADHGDRDRILHSQSDSLPNHQTEDSCCRRGVVVDGISERSIAAATRPLAADGRFCCRLKS